MSPLWEISYILGTSTLNCKHFPPQQALICVDMAIHVSRYKVKGAFYTAQKNKENASALQCSFKSTSLLGYQTVQLGSDTDL